MREFRVYLNGKLIETLETRDTDLTSERLYDVLVNERRFSKKIMVQEIHHSCE